METLNYDKNKQRPSELKEAVNQQKFKTDYNEIWNAINDGKGKTLFVKKGLFPPINLINNHIEIITKDNGNQANVVDIIDEMIENNIKRIGEVIFIKGEELEKFNGLVLVTRY